MNAKTLRHVSLAAIGLLAVAGCASGPKSMSGDECRGADWFEVGRQDALDGEIGEALDRRIGACGKAGVSVDQSAYRRGREAGLVEFCKPDNAFDFGAGGGEYHRTCMPGDEQFRLAWAEGYRGFELRSTIAEAKRKLPKLSQDIVAAEREMTVLNNELLGSGRNEQLSMTADVDRLRRRLDKSRSDQIEWQRKLEYATQQLQEFERRYGSGG